MIQHVMATVTSPFKFSPLSIRQELINSKQGKKSARFSSLCYSQVNWNCIFRIESVTSVLLAMVNHKICQVCENEPTCSMRAPPLLLLTSPWRSCCQWLSWELKPHCSYRYMTPWRWCCSKHQPFCTPTRKAPF